MVKNFIFLGPPGVGKGTLAAKISATTKITHISTGDIFRSEIKAKTALGQKIVETLAAGNYVTDEITNKIVLKRLQDPLLQQNGFILDGYPRTLNQAQFLAQQNFQIDEVILLDAPEAILIKRLSGRRVCPFCKASYHIIYKKPRHAKRCDNDGTTLVRRRDDQVAAIQKRLVVYKQQTKILIPFYEQNGNLQKLDGSQNIATTLETFVEHYFD